MSLANRDQASRVLVWTWLGRVEESNQARPNTLDPRSRTLASHIMSLATFPRPAKPEQPSSLRESFAMSVAVQVYAGGRLWHDMAPGERDEIKEEQPGEATFISKRHRFAGRLFFSFIVFRSFARLSSWDRTNQELGQPLTPCAALPKRSGSWRWLSSEFLSCPKTWAEPRSQAPSNGEIFWWQLWGEALAGCSQTFLHIEQPGLFKVVTDFSKRWHGALASGADSWKDKEIPAPLPLLPPHKINQFGAERCEGQSFSLSRTFAALFLLPNSIGLSWRGGKWSGFSFSDLFMALSLSSNLFSLSQLQRQLCLSWFLTATWR